MAFLNDNKLTESPQPWWFSSQSGIYQSTHSSIPLPNDTKLDVVSHLFSLQNDVVSPSSTALIDAVSGNSFTYGQLRRRVESLSASLRSLLAGNDVVLLLLPNSVHFPVALLAALRSGAAVSAASPLSSGDEVRRLVAAVRPRLAFAGRSQASTLRALGVETIVVPDGASEDSESEFFKLVAAGEAAAEAEPRPAVRQSDAAVIMYSSGTTGTSKGVVLSHGNLIAMVELFVRFEASQYLDSASEAVYLAVLPMFHIYGMSLFALGLLSLGAAIVVMSGKFDVEEAAMAVERFGVTHFPVVPPILAAMARTRRRWSLKQVSCGAAPLTAKAIQDFVNAFPDVDFIQGYGMTESTAVGTRGFNTNKLKNFASVGLLAPNMEAKVVDWTTGSFMPPGSSGELWLRGPAIMKGYLNNKAETMATINKDGWLRTGDIVYFDQDGYLYVVDRLKEIIKYKGYQIAPADLEAVLASHPEILDVAVASVADEESGEIPVAFVVRKIGSMLSEEAVIDYVARQVSPYKKIRKVVFTPSIPRSAAGKILRRELRKALTSKL